MPGTGWNKTRSKRQSRDDGKLHTKRLPPPLSWWRPKGSFSHSNPSQQRGQRTHWPDVILGLVSFVPTWQSAAEVASSDVHFPPWLRCRRWTISGQRQNREHGGGCMLKKHARVGLPITAAISMLLGGLQPTQLGRAEALLTRERLIRLLAAAVGCWERPCGLPSLLMNPTRTASSSAASTCEWCPDRECYHRMSRC